jgi:mannose-1-phosphate guanylyltransferase
VAVFPSDHFVLEEGVFMNHVARVAAWVRSRAQAIVLLGAEPTEPETDYGWIEPGDPLDAVAPVWRVRRFWEKPLEQEARACLAAGCLWNTFVLVARVSTLLDAERECLPALHDRLSRIGPFAGTEHESWMTRQAYALAPHANFSRAILAPCPRGLVVSKLPPVTWCDWGTPERIIRSITKVGISPPWLNELNRPA